MSAALQPLSLTLTGQLGLTPGAFDQLLAHRRSLTWFNAAADDGSGGLIRDTIGAWSLAERIGGPAGSGAGTGRCLTCSRLSCAVR